MHCNRQSLSHHEAQQLPESHPCVDDCFAVMLLSSERQYVNAAAVLSLDQHAHVQFDLLHGADQNTMSHQVCRSCWVFKLLL